MIPDISSSSVSPISSAPPRVPAAATPAGPDVAGLTAFYNKTLTNTARITGGDLGPGLTRESLAGVG